MIRPGVTVAGLDVGGQTLSQAAGTIDRAYRHQLVTRNVSVRVGGKGYSLRTKKVGFVFDPAKSARRAYIAGNDTAGAQAGGRAAVDELRQEEAGRVRRARGPRRAASPPVNATVRITLAAHDKRASKSGREMDDKALAKALDARAGRSARAAPAAPEARGRQGRRCARRTSRTATARS